MKKGIHPRYVLAKVVCGSCGTTFMTGSTKPEIHVEVCANCHPFFTGKQQIIDTAGRVERFTRRYERARVGGGSEADVDARPSSGPRSGPEKKEKAEAGAEPSAQPKR